MNKLVKYDNKMNEVSFGKFNSAEMDLFFSLCSKLREKNTKKVTLSFEELRMLSSYKPTANTRFVADIARTYDKMLSLKCTLGDVQGDFIRFVLFTEFDVSRKNQTVTLACNERWKWVLNELTSNFTRFELAEFTKLRSVYAKTAYRLLKQFRHTGRLAMKWEEFKEQMGCPKSYRAKDIDERILEPIIEELSPIFGNMKTTKKKAKRRGSPIIAIEFTFVPEVRNSDFEYVRTDEKEEITPESLTCRLK